MERPYTKAWNIFLHPGRELKQFIHESYDVNQLMIYIGNLAVILSISQLIRFIFIEQTDPVIGSFNVSPGIAITIAAVDLFIILGGAFLWGIILNKSLEFIAHKPNMVRSMKLISYVLTPILLTSFLVIIPFGKFIHIAPFLYSVFLLKKGVDEIFTLKKRQSFEIFVICLIIGILIFLALFFVTESLVNIPIKRGYGTLGYT